MLPPGFCDVWLASPDVFAPYRDELDTLLSPPERERVQRQWTPRSREVARLSRAVLRLLLASYVDADPRELDVDRRCALCAEPHGKPLLRGRDAPHFSLAHCDDLLVLVVTSVAPIGVDVESLAGRAGAPPEKLVDLVLTPAERRCVEDVAPADRWRAFLRYWTGKEAILKQSGAGLSVPLHTVPVPYAGTDGDLDVDGRVRTAEQVWVHPLDLGDLYVGAVATVGEAVVGPVREVPLTLLAAPRASLC